VSELLYFFLDVKQTVPMAYDN